MVQFQRKVYNLLHTVKRLQHSSRCANMPSFLQLQHVEVGPTVDAELVKRACASLRRGNVLALPTDTVYGVAGLAQSSDAVAKLYHIKGRDAVKPISISVADLHDVNKWATVTVSDDLLADLLPGPVTVVFHRTAALNPRLNPETSLVGVRVPDSGFVRDVCRLCSEPLALTSANVSGQPSSLCIQEFEALWPQLDIIFDAGVLSTSESSKLGSTVVDLSQPGVYNIIRPGSAENETISTLRRHGWIERSSS